MEHSRNVVRNAVRPSIPPRKIRAQAERSMQRSTKRSTERSTERTKFTKKHFEEKTRPKSHYWDDLFFQVRYVTEYALNLIWGQFTGKSFAFFFTFSTIQKKSNLEGVLIFFIGTPNLTKI